MFSKKSSILIPLILVLLLGVYIVCFSSQSVAIIDDYANNSPYLLAGGANLLNTAENGGGINGVVASELISAVGGKNTTYGTKSCHNIRSNPIVVKVGDLKYQVVYRVNNFLTLWCVNSLHRGSTPVDTFQFDENGVSFHVNEIYTYTYSDIFQQCNTYYNEQVAIYPSLSSIITTPLVVGYQGSQSDCYFGTGVEDQYTYNSMNGTALASKFWLPSAYETVSTSTVPLAGFFNKYFNNTTTATGLWGLYSTDRGHTGNSGACWLRSGAYEWPTEVVKLRDDGSPFSQSASTWSNFRPAMHISIASLPTTATLSINRNNTSGGSITGAGTYNIGANVTVTATPGSNYVFDGWRLNSSSGAIQSYSTTYNFTLNDNTTLVACFSLKTFYLTLNRNNVSGGTVSGAGTFSINSSVTASATPSAGYIFQNWRANSSTGAIISTLPSYAFNITSNTSLVACFVAGANITIASGINGYVVMEDGENNYTIQEGENQTYSYASDTLLMLTPTSNAGYIFDYWSLDGGSTIFQLSNPLSYSVGSSSQTLTAVFSVKCTISAIANNPEFGNTTGGGNYAPNTSVTLTAIPNNGYSFAGWQKLVDVSLEFVTAEPTYTVVITTGAQYVAVFTPNILDRITVQQSTGGYAKIDSNGDGFIGDVVIIRAQPYAGYNFSHWLDVGNDETFSTDIVYRFTVTSETPMLLRAIFALDDLSTTHEIVINSLADLCRVSNYVNGGQNLQNVIIYLESNLDIGKIADVVWKPIGNETTKFTGIFQGNNYTITDSANSGLTLFADGTTGKIWGLRNSNLTNNISIENNFDFFAGDSTDGGNWVEPIPETRSGR